MQVNGKDMLNATHAEAVALLKSITDVCQMVVSREVLVVMGELCIQVLPFQTYMWLPAVLVVDTQGVCSVLHTCTCFQ